MRKDHEEERRYKKRYYLENKEKMRWQKLHKRYGISVNEWEEMLLKQNSGCAICGKELDARTAHVDHDHETGKVRGLLCRACNFALGQLQDNPALLRRAAEYVERSNNG